MRRNQSTGRGSDSKGTERWDNEGGTVAPLPREKTEKEKRWGRALGRRRHGYKPTGETQARTVVEERTRAQKPIHVPSLPPREGKAN